MSAAQDSGRVYALLADGTTVEIRQACADDFDAVQAMHEAMAPDNIYLRFFSYSRRSAETEARRICRDPDRDTPGSAALLALRDHELAFPLPREEDGTALDTYLSAVAERESSADVASLRHIFAPESVVVIGASRRREAIGRVILENTRGGGYAGRLYTVNPRARQIDGDRCLASVLDLPEPADLAVIAVPAPTVLGVAEHGGQRGVRAL